jgi:hypothetical protein
MSGRERVRTARGCLSVSGPRQLLMVLLALSFGSLCSPSSAQVTIHDPSAAYSGYNLRVSDSPAGAVLMDMEGDVLHRWTCSVEDAFPGADVQELVGFPGRWTSARLLPDGDVIGIIGGVGAVRLDWSSRVVWAHEGGEHGDLAVSEDGTIYALAVGTNRVAWVNQKEPVVEDFVLVLDTNGQEVDRFSLLGAIQSSDFRNMTKAARMDRAGHILRANSIDVLDENTSGQLPSFGKGDVFVSLPGLDSVAILDVESGAIVWTQFGLWLDQMHATLLPGGDVLLLHYAGGDPRVVEFDPITQEVKWSYARDSDPLPEGPGGGACQRLPNGNTLISESGRGRAFEVTREGELVWEYVDPGPARDGEVVAAPFGLVRIDPESLSDWMGN